MQRSICLMLQICLCSLSICFASDSCPSFRLLILHEKGSLGGIHKSDAKDVKKSFQTVAEVLKMPIHTTQLQCHRASMPSVRKWCSKIKKHDTVVMYYSGPNPSKPSYRGSWPLIAIGKDAIPVDEVAKEVHSRKAKLSLIFIDCYDKLYHPIPLDRGVCGESLKKITWKPFRRNLTKAWMSARGTLTMCSKKHGKTAHGVIWGGGQFGAFTEALLLAIEEGTGSYRFKRKISEFPTMIHRRLTSHRFYQNETQCPFSQSTIREVK